MILELIILTAGAIALTINGLLIWWEYTDAIDELKGEQK